MSVYIVPRDKGRVTTFEIQRDVPARAVGGGLTTVRSIVADDFATEAEARQVAVTLGLVFDVEDFDIP